MSYDKVLELLEENKVLKHTVREKEMLLDFYKRSNQRLEDRIHSLVVLNSNLSSDLLVRDRDQAERPIRKKLVDCVIPCFKTCEIPDGE